MNELVLYTSDDGRTRLDLRVEGRTEVQRLQLYNLDLILRETYIDPALGQGLVERTIPEKPTSRLQKYRLTQMGRSLLAQLNMEGGRS